MKRQRHGRNGAHDSEVGTVTSDGWRSSGSAAPARHSEHADVTEILNNHEHWRLRTLNLIASENVISPSVIAGLSHDLLGRYADFSGRDLKARRYRGTKYIAALEQRVDSLARQVFGARYVELRCTSGHLAGVAVTLGVCRPGDVVLELARDAGGHRQAERLASSTDLICLSVKALPFDQAVYNIDTALAIELIGAVRPRLVILGSSNFLFPHPVAEIAQAIHDVPGAVLAYDASHVMGFLAAHRFQRPLEEGADVVFGSTHKTLPGPQGGIIFSNRPDIIEAVSRAAYPGLVTNHHPFRMGALALALEEAQIYGAEYCDQMVRNANALAAAMSAAGVAPVSVSGTYTKSHTIVIPVTKFGSAGQVAERLEKYGVITSTSALPPQYGGEGIRIGVQEITRRGADTTAAEEIGSIVAAGISRTEPPATVRKRAKQVAAKLDQIRFTYTTEDGK
jgi:glycine hydroxymethyltransferase